MFWEGGRNQNYAVAILAQVGSNDGGIIKIQATQNVWSKILLDIRTNNENILLLPIAADQNLTSLNLLLDSHGISSFPAVVVNNKKVIYDLENAGTITPYLESFN